MAKKQRMWVYSPPKPPAPKVSASTKGIVQQKADELVEKVLKPKHIQPPPAANTNRWAAYTYLCENIPELVISAKSCILKSYNGGIKNGFLRAYRYLVGQERADIDG